jgi:hypothetical protein
MEKHIAWSEQLENTEGAIKKGQSREDGTRRRKTEQRITTTYVYISTLTITDSDNRLKSIIFSWYSKSTYQPFDM